MRWVMLGAELQDAEYLYELQSRADNATIMSLLGEVRAMGTGFPSAWNPSCGNKSWVDDGYYVDDPARASLGSSRINDLKLRLGQALT